MVVAIVCLATVKRPICFAAANVRHSSQDTHFSALLLGLLPVHTITSVGAWGFSGPLEHVAAAAASAFSGHSDLLVASADNETEHMKDSAAASVAAFVLDGHTNLLLTPAANAGLQLDSGLVGVFFSGTFVK